jgi:dolichyl-diphosphooligosaccharide--protein glycosyltransferase
MVAGLIVMWHAYDIRLFAIREYGAIIHEFDPYFNYRAAEYLADNGWTDFFRWFDHMSWYPLGRPVGTTIYPGPQLAAVGIWRALTAWHSALKGIGLRSWTLVEVCCYIPAWFGILASAFVGLFAVECTDSSAAGLVAAYVMAIVPAHAQRSVGGGFDNEAVAIAPMCAVFYFWSRSLRSSTRLTQCLCAILGGICYAGMAASWGGYVFAINLVGAHALLLTALRGWNVVHEQYSLFFSIGTALAVQVPVVGWTPLRSLEHCVPVLAFVLLQLLALRARVLERAGSLLASTPVAVLAVCMGAVGMGWGNVFVWPASARVRALFGAHATRTGNPLVDSVSEHQPATPEAYDRFVPASIAGFCVLASKRQHVGINRVRTRCQGRV